MSAPKVIVLLLVSSMLFSYLAKATPYCQQVGDILETLQQQGQQPMHCKEIVFTLHLNADPTCTLESLQKVLMPIVALIEQAPEEEEKMPLWFGSLGSPFKELTIGANTGSNIHGFIGAHIDLEKLEAVFEVAVSRADECDEQVWAQVVQESITMLARYADGRDCLAMPIQEVVRRAQETSAIHIQLMMEFSLSDDERIQCIL